MGKCVCGGGGGGAADVLWLHGRFSAFARQMFPASKTLGGGRDIE